MTTHADWGNRKIRGYLPKGEKIRLREIPVSDVMDTPVGTRIYFLEGKYYADAAQYKAWRYSQSTSQGEL